MAKVITDNQHYADIAAAIRTKNETDTLYKPLEMAPAILAIQGGVELNFKVVGGEKPSDPEPNTIWVDTSEEITGWSFSATEPPAPANGMVWFYVDNASDVHFNALKENEIIVYLSEAKQYRNSSWERVAISFYVENIWTSIIPTGFLFCSGHGENANFTVYKEEKCFLNVTNEYVEFDMLNEDKSYTQGAYYTKANLSGYNYLKAKVTVTELGERTNTTASLAYSTLSNTPGIRNGYEKVAETVFSICENETYSLDISAQNGEFYVAISGNMRGKVFDIWLE